MLTEHILRRLSVGMCLKHLSFSINFSLLISLIICTFFGGGINWDTKEILSSEVESETHD